MLNIQDQQHESKVYCNNSSIGNTFRTLGGFFIKKTTYEVPEGKVLVSEGYLDSLKNIASLPPTIIIKDSIIHDTIRIPYNHDPQPQPDSVDSTLYVYNDSLVIKDSVDVSINFKSKGLVVGGINWLYTPITHIKEIKIETKVPVPMPYEVSVPTYKTGIYISGVVQGGENIFMIGSDLDIVSKNDYIYGIQYRRYDNQNVYGVKFGIRLFKKK